MKKTQAHFMLIGALIIAAAVPVLTNLSCRFAEPAGNKLSSLSAGENGAVLYRKYCSMCHGITGEGYLADEANALSNQDFLVSAGDEFIIDGILEGRPGTPMSAWGKEKGGVLTREDASEILSFIRSWQKEPSVELSRETATGNSENGAKIYEKSCAECHGISGRGGKAVKLNNPVFQQTASDGYIRYAIENGRRQTPMSAFKTILGGKDIDDLIVYIRTLKTESAFQDTVASAEEDFSTLIKEKGVLNPGNPPANFSQGRYVPADEVYAAYNSAQSFIIIDARPHSDYLIGHIKGAISIPFYDMEKAVGLLPKDLWIITYCACPHTLSGKAADTLKSAGFDKVGVLNEGIYYWHDKGYPLE